MSETALTDSTEPSVPPCVDGRPDLRQIDIHDVAELMLRMIGDADGSDVAFNRDPLVFLRVPKIVWIHVYFARL